MEDEFKIKILKALFPPDVVCCSCGRESVVMNDGLCMDCHSGLEIFNAAPPPAFTDGFASVYVYNDVSGKMVQRLKYGGEKHIAKRLADAIEIPKDWKIDAVVPVPLYYRKLWRRGYNQSELIAKHLCERLKLKLEPGLLVKTRETIPQAGLSENDRKHNLKGAFAADSSVRGKKILLLDDVRTTGSTLAECAEELKKHGAGKVWAVTVCAARPEKAETDA